MKANYQKPMTCVTTVKLQQMTAATTSKALEAGFNLENDVTDLNQGITSGNLSRRYSIWDDEDE